MALTKKMNSCGRFIAQHGLSNTKEHRAWANMLDRCENNKSAQFSRYGGRGIRVCERWHEFENFIADIGFAQYASLSVERADVNGDYEPHNCRWASPKEQANNRTNTRFLVFGGIKKSLADWCVETGFNYTLAATRWRRGWREDRIFNEIEATYANR